MHRPDVKCGRKWKKRHGYSTVKKDAPVVLYVFADPFCPYCKQFWQQARPWVESGKVQLRTLLVGVIKPESPATAAAILAAKDPAKTWHDYEAPQEDEAGGSGVHPPGADESH